jgi:hypothetical protein
VYHLEPFEYLKEGKRRIFDCRFICIAERLVLFSIPEKKDLAFLPAQYSIIIPIFYF